MAVAEGLEPSRGRINSAVPYQLGYATIWWLWVDSNHQPSAYETLALSIELHSRVCLEARGAFETPESHPRQWVDHSDLFLHLLN